MDVRQDLAAARRDRAEAMDRRLADAFALAVPDDSGIALVATGGYGRGELSPYSDVDVVLVHAEQVPVAPVDEVAARLWSALWEQKVPIDQSVRSLAQMTKLAEQDFRVAMGLLDARHVAGDGGVVLELRSTVLTAWRRDARRRLAEVRADRDTRLERSGQLAYEAVPDLKSSGGGLRDCVILRAIAATWLVDVPAAELAQLTAELLDVRDLLHEVSGRRTDKLLPDLVPEMAARLDMAPAAFDVEVRDLGRRVDHLVARSCRRLDVLARDPHRRIGRAGPRIEPIAPGVGALDGEIVLTPDADPAADPTVLLRMATTAARRELPLNEASLARLEREVTFPEAPLGAEAHRWLVDLLSTGRRLVPVWLQLDFAGIIERVLPEWSGIRLRGSSSPVHRYTVDRHSLEACVNADELNREVARPDLLAAAGILHDIGKGLPGDHSEVGAPLATQIARRWGFAEDDAQTIGRLVRWHLLLPTIATRRDIEDPLTAANVAEVVGTEDFLDLLAATTACDAMATGPSAWTEWRRGLIDGLVEKTRVRLRGETAEAPADYGGWPAHVPLPAAGEVRPDELRLQAETHHGGSLLTAVSANRPGMLADLAGGFTLAGLNIRSCRMVTVGDAAATLWEVTRPDVDATALAERMKPVLQGRVDLAHRLSYSLAHDEYEPRVTVLDAMEQTATLLEVRALDRRGLMWTVCHTIASLGHHIRSAHLSTFGDEVRDVFYVTDDEALALYDDEAEVLRRAVHAALA